jgi:HD-GYP domain-containing protein (c-di-GMP phosphodiesterase class II)
VLRSNGLPAKGIYVSVLLMVLVVVSIVIPSARLAALQLLYIPILLAAYSWGLSSALGVGLVAAMDATIPAFVQVREPWVVQAGLYVAFAGTSAWLLRRRHAPKASSAMRQRESSSSSVGRDRVLESLARTVEVRDNHSQGHSRRVAKNAVVLGAALGLGAEELDVLYWAALLHDIGKIAVPEYILMKNGRLSEDEFAEIRRHPGYGADLLASVSQDFRPIADVVRAHHERWDGLGYPLGYRGDEIPKLSRIIAIVDVFEALTSLRPYRSPMPVGQALRYVVNGAGTQFDPRIVPVFESLVDEGQVENGTAFAGPSVNESVKAESVAPLPI